jgi:hypothetical protein
MLELGQLGHVGLNDANLLYVHKDPISYNNNQKIKNLIDELTSALISKKKFRTKSLEVLFYNYKLKFKSFQMRAYQRLKMKIKRYLRLRSNHF